MPDEAQPRSPHDRPTKSSPIVDEVLGVDGNQYLDSQFRDIRLSIARRATALAEKGGGEEGKERPVRLRFVIDATEEFAPGTQRQPCLEAAEVKFWHRLTDGLNGVTLIGALLALAFALMALWNTIPSQQNSFLDLAKLMTGVIVGSGAGAVVTAVSKGRSTRSD